MPGVTSCRYAPIDAWTSARSAVILPSFVAASSSVVTKSRPWIVASAFSERSSIHFTGVPRRRASATASNSSA